MRGESALPFWAVQRAALCWEVAWEGAWAGPIADERSSGGSASGLVCSLTAQCDRLDEPVCESRIFGRVAAWLHVWLGTFWVLLDSVE